MAGPFYFAMVDKTDSTWSSGFEREDLAVFAFNLNQTEGEFAELRLSVQNPHTGLLTSGRHQWLWFSWDDGSTVHPLFFGQIMAIPDDLEAEIVDLVYVAKPVDYDVRKLTLANTLKVAPYYDPVFVNAEAAANPDTVLEARSALWHIDRTTHDVTISDIIAGEDGTIAIGGGFFYDGMRVSYPSQQVRRVDVTARVHWRQQAWGLMDISSQFPNPIETFTGEGIYNAWPTPGTKIGPNWEVFAAEPLVGNVGGNLSANGIYFGTSMATNQFYIGTQDGQLGMIELWPMIPFMVVKFHVEREFEELLRFSLVADVQLIMPDNDLPAPTNSAVPTISPIIPSAIVRQNRILYATTGTWTNTPTVFNYQWLKGGVEIPGANAAYYSPTDNDIGYPLTVRVTASNRGGFASAMSAATANVEAAIAYFRVQIDHLSAAYFDPNAVLGQVPAGIANPYALGNANLVTLLLPRNEPLYTELPPDYSSGGADWAPATNYTAGTIVAVPWDDPPPLAGVLPPVVTQMAPISRDVFRLDLSGQADVFVDPPATAGGLPSLPIGDPSGRRYFQTTRGQQSVTHALLAARAHLLAAARAVDITVQVPFATGIAATLRKSASITDARLPGGAASGKIKSYAMELNGDRGEAFVTLTISCTIGHGGSYSAASGTPSYIGTGYANGVQGVTGAETAAPTGDVGFADFSAIEPWDDKIDFANFRPDQAVKWVKVYLDAAEQASLGLGVGFGRSTLFASGQNFANPLIHNALTQAALDAKLAGLYTTIELRMHDFAPGPITTPFDIGVSQLVVPKTIDLEAA